MGGNLYPETAFLYENGVMRDLGGLVSDPDREFGSAARGINNLGQIVGVAGVGPAANHGFLYDDGRMTDLNALVDPASGLGDHGRRRHQRGPPHRRPPSQGAPASACRPVLPGRSAPRRPRGPAR
ncbi:hypothetical protein [Massilia phosphatilytica]